MQVHSREPCVLKLLCIPIINYYLFSSIFCHSLPTMGKYDNECWIKVQQSSRCHLRCIADAVSPVTPLLCPPSSTNLRQARGCRDTPWLFPAVESDSNGAFHSFQFHSSGCNTVHLLATHYASQLYTNASCSLLTMRPRMRKYESLLPDQGDFRWLPAGTTMPISALFGKVVFPVRM